MVVYLVSALQRVHEIYPIGISFNIPLRMEDNKEQSKGLASVVSKNTSSKLG